MCTLYSRVLDRDIWVGAVLSSQVSQRHLGQGCAKQPGLTETFGSGMRLGQGCAKQPGLTETFVSGMRLGLGCAKQPGLTETFGSGLC